MSSLTSKDRVSPCLFTFTDGRRCRTPRSGTHPHFCFYHARKQSRAQIADTLGRELSYFFSGNYVSACDLSIGLGRILAGVARGDIKPKTATTLAYLAQTLVQTIHIAEHEYINAFGTDGWRKAVRNSVDQNSEYGNPQPPQTHEPDEPEESPARPQTQTPVPAPQRSASVPAPQPQQPEQPAQSPAQPETSTPVWAGLVHPELQRGRPDGTRQPDAAASTSSSVGVQPQPPSSAPAQQSTTPLDAQPSSPESATAQSSEPGADPAEQTAQPAPPITQPTPATAALSVARSIFRRPPRTNPANPFKNNIYTPPRNC
ncbi:MAG: hypothetical protein ACYDCG_13585 [Candidatus Acidiferrales bacterium]